MNEPNILELLNGLVVLYALYWGVIHLNAAKITTRQIGISALFFVIILFLFIVNFSSLPPLGKCSPMQHFEYIILGLGFTGIVVNIVSGVRAKDVKTNE